MISQTSIQEVLNRVDIIDVVGQFVRLKKRGASYIANCPFHNEKTPSFTYQQQRGYTSVLVVERAVTLLPSYRNMKS